MQIRSIVVLSIFFMMGFISSTEATTLSVSPSNQDVEVEGEVEVEVVVEGAQGLMGFQVDISYDWDILEYIGADLSGGITATLLGPAEIDFKDGRKGRRIGAYIMAPKGSIISDNGLHSLVTIRFTGKQEGISELRLSGGILIGQGAVKMATTYEGGSIRVINPNQPPVFDDIKDKTVKEGKLLEFIVSARDPDGDELNYTAINLPEGARFETVTQSGGNRVGQFRWQPSYEQQGEYNVTFRVTDGELEDKETITITVIDVPQYNGIIEGKVYGIEYSHKRMWWWYRWWYYWFTRHQPLDGATVTLSGRGIQEVDITDTTGSYSFEGVSAGIYRITASKDGYSPSTRWVWLSRYRAIVRIDFYLRPLYYF